MMDMYENIEAYVSGKLRGDALMAFEAALQSDPELQSLVDNHDSIKSVSVGLLESVLLNEVKQVSEDIVKSNLSHSNKKKSVMFNWIILGLLALLCFAIYYISNSADDEISEPIDVKRLIAQAYQEPIWPAKRGDESGLLSIAIGEFRYGDRKRAINILVDSLQETHEGKYWLSELYFTNDKIDSSMNYLPSPDEYASKKDRINYLKMLGLISKNKKEEAKAVATLLPPKYITSEMSDYLGD